jgi:hypothetical protein
MITNIENLKKNDFFKTEKGAKVYIYKGYDRINKKYEGNAFNDISDFNIF